MKEIKYHSNQEQETLYLGRVIGENAEPGQSILLHGELGSGKTILVKGIARGLEILEQINSPTYVFINEYQGRLPLFHLDLYRLESRGELREIGFEEYLEHQGVMVIEWPELARDQITEDFLDIEIERKFFSEGKVLRRVITLKGQGEQSLALLEKITDYIEEG